MYVLNITKLTQKELEKLSHKLPNYTLFNYYSLKTQVQQIHDNYLSEMPILLVIIITVGISLVGYILILGYHYQRCRNTKMVK